ncbi:MAG: glycosyltransferase family 2 protein [Lachnospiraceae bacterium]|nr:glycosyltransferase family 2 protein [Candidatus Merdinaster equi]
MTSVTIIFTCYNRKEKSAAFVKSVQDENLDIRFVVTDDGSTDGTDIDLQKLIDRGYHLDIVKGDGKLYWCGGMRKAVDYILNKNIKSDYYVFANDDVDVFDHALYEMVVQSKKHGGSVVVGVTCDHDGNMTYGGIRYRKNGIKYDHVDVTSEDLSCDSFNCNLVLIPSQVFHQLGNFDEHFTHSMGDFDYGLRVKKSGIPIESTRRYVGICERNPLKKTWSDRNLSRKERFELKRSPKGLPHKEWFYFLNKHFGLWTAITRSISPYFKILLGK